MMRKILILFVFMVCAASLAAQSSGNTLQLIHDSILKAYFVHRDTMTVRTWVNVITANKYLEEIRIIDSILLLENSKAIEKPYQMINDLQEEIDSLIKHNQIQNERPISVKARSSLGNTTYLFIILISVIFLTLFVLLFFGYSASKRKAKNRENESRNFLSKLNEANDDIEKMQQTEKDLAHKFNLMKTDFDDQIKKLLLLKSAIEDEKILLENQIIEVKKAYDHEVLRRMEMESDMVLSQQKDRLSRNDSTEKNKIFDLEEKIRLLAIENEKITTDLDKTLAALEGEVSIRKNSEISLNGLIFQLEHDGFLQDGNRDVANITDGMKTYKKLLIENELLSKALEETRSDYNKELILKRQMEEDLNQIIARFKTNNSQ